MTPSDRKPRPLLLPGQHIKAVGNNSEILSFRSKGTLLIDCQRLTLIPGLNDAHCHLLATASALLSINCTSPEINSLGELFNAVRQETRKLAPGRWVRGFGLDPAQLAEGRYPTRWELDRIAPAHPVRLEHTSSHAAVLNSKALEAAGIGDQTPDPIDGVINREAISGKPTGLLLEMSGFLRERLEKTRSQEELEQGVKGLNEKLLGCGITSVQDAGPGNGLEQWHTFQSLIDRELFAPRITMMAAAVKLDDFVSSGLEWGSGDERLSLGHAKIMLTQTTGQLYPPSEDLQLLAATALAKGFSLCCSCRGRSRN